MQRSFPGVLILIGLLWAAGAGSLAVAETNGVTITPEWTGNDLFTLPAYGITLRRPRSGWRFLTASYPEAVELRYDRPGANVSVHVRELIPLGGTSTRGRKGKEGRSERAERLLVPYEGRGIQFYEVRERENDMYAAGTDAERRLIFLHIHFVRRERHALPVVVEMTIPREIYHDFHPDFLELVSPMAIWSPSK